MKRRILSRAGVALIPLLLLAGVAAAAGEMSQDREAELVRRATEEVLRELREGGSLQEEIQAGIERYVQEQRAAQARAQAEQRRTATRRARDVRRVSAGRDHVYGAPDAEISLIEYSDFECPFCKRFHATARAAVDASDGTVNWVYRHFPLAFHNPLAQKEAEASECAAELGGNEAFWRYTDAVFERTRSNGKGLPMESLVPLAAELGLDASRFRECLDSGRQAGRVQEDIAEGRAIGISGTPGNVLLNNRTGAVRVVPGAVPLPQLQAAIDTLRSDPERRDPERRDAHAGRTSR